MSGTRASFATYEQQADLFLHLLRQHAPDLGPQARILDLGCGRGELVKALRDRGVLAWGSDPGTTPEFGDADWYLQTDPVSFRVAAPAATFDAVVSNQVLEHVMDLPGAFLEIRRLLRLGGVGLHLFPSRWCLLEPHTWVPLGGVFRNRPYLSAWAHFGIRNAFQTGYRAAQVAELNRNYLTSQTNYPTQKVLEAMLTPHFSAWKFIEEDLLSFFGQNANTPPWKRRLCRMAQATHLSPLYRTFRARALWIQG